MNAIQQETPEERKRRSARERKAKSRAKKRAMEEAGLCEFPHDAYPKLEAMEAFYDAGERLDTEDPAEIFNAVFLTLHENPPFMTIIKKSLSARRHCDIGSEKVEVKLTVNSILDRMMKEQADA